ncbi:ABC transporter substrate-binding protein [Leucobacter viscericola]|uniref:ABC transporter substrate-binding protein n=1 Tax=Leucobacter viscericola TaxID=2714935 RepID=A0A6G7XEQ0_9MICO|nr:ABC transporter substrate-binding protein [Leucobacter viscericola]QIK62946.1 ABC transporter substrate-binding protein [Leucobacter viscericola]
MSRKLLVSLISAVAVVVAVVLVVVFLWIPRSQPKPDPIAATVPVALSKANLPKGVKIGIIVTAGSGAAEGAEWRAAAEGARVAQQRLALGGTQLKLVTEDDRGTSAGGKEAVDALIDEDVAGIVLASSGKHLGGAIEAAAEAGVPVILPYAQPPKGSESVWSLDSAETDNAEKLESVLSEYRHPLFVDAGSTLPEGVRIDDRVAYKSGTELPAFVDTLVHRTGTDALAGGAYGGGEHEDEPKKEPVEDPADALLISGNPALQATIVAALQQRGVSVPILMTPEAISPTFSATLLERGGSVTPQLRTVGNQWNDTLALNADAQGRSMSAFLAATRQFTYDKNIKNLSEDASFDEVAGNADVRSHDAVIALVEAISQANSIEPKEVERKLSGLTLNSGDGIAGPDLDFSSPEANKGEVSVMRATDQYLGLRSQVENGTDRLVWFTEPISDGTQVSAE